MSRALSYLLRRSIYSPWPSRQRPLFTHCGHPSYSCSLCPLFTLHDHSLPSPKMFIFFLAANPPQLLIAATLTLFAPFMSFTASSFTTTFHSHFLQPSQHDCECLAPLIRTAIRVCEGAIFMYREEKKTKKKTKNKQNRQNRQRA